MASNALTGDRRWASGRRGGMTVLGKVTVPKPINLPSQRLENHGLDPNMEIVPKGTLSWGSRKSATSNAWGSCTLSPKTDSGDTLSPSNLCARPSSGVNGTRPSTADSDMAYEPSITAWGTSSRPSSASGVHTSSQTLSVFLRPRSAETRPGSSQLSLLAESMTENSVAGVVERMGMISSRNDGFSLSSGDFPVLGSDKNSSGKSTVSQEHPSEGSGSHSVTITRGREGDFPLENEVKSGVLNSWRREDTAFGEVRPSIDKWQGESPPYPKSGMRPQHINAWRSPMVNNHPPGSSWYRRPPGGPYGGPVAPGGFPMEPFPYYHRAAAPVLPNPLPAPPSGAGPKGHSPNSGDLYRPPIPDAFVRPNIPTGPGFYPGPLPYDGYFGPPLRYRSPNEQDISFVGFPLGVPSPYCRYPAPENGSSSARYAGFGDKLLGSEKDELDCSHENSAQYEVLLKQHDSWDDGEEEHCQSESKAISELSLNRGAQCKRVSPENDRKLECIKGIEKNSEIGDPKSYPKSDERVGASVPWRVNSSGCLPVHPNDVDPARRSEDKHAAAEVSQTLSAATKEFSLIQKIENLNAKARASDNQPETSPVSDRPEQPVNVQMPLLSHSTTEIASEAQFVKKNQDTQNTKLERSGQVFATGCKSREQSAVGGAIFSRLYQHGGQGRGDHHGGRFVMQENVEWHYNPIGVDSSMPSMETSNRFPNTDAGDHLVSQPSKNEGESKPVAVDSSDSLAERARLKELAKKRVRQRQEEEERARDQKARVLMKLEELNKRRQLEDSLNSKTENISSSGTGNKGEQQQRSLPPLERNNTSATSAVLTCRSCFEGLPLPHSDKHVRGVDGSDISSSEAASRNSQTSHLSRDSKSVAVANHIPGNRSYRHNLVASKEKPNMSLEKTFFGEPPKVDSQTAVVAKSGESVSDEITPSAEKIHPSGCHNVLETTVHQQRKGSKTNRTKHKVGALSPASVLIATVEEASRLSTPEENRASKSLKPDMDSSFIQPSQDSEDLKQSFEQPLAVSTETALARVNFLGRTQHPRRTPRNQQVSKQSEKSHGSEAVMWAPRSQNKSEVAVETNDEISIDLANLSLKNDVSQKNPKHKRAEMERYVPKPVAKEMGQRQQGNISLVATRNNKSILTEGTAPSVSSASHCLIENDQSLKPVLGKETRNLDSRTNKPGGAVGLWRQRWPTELTTERKLHPSESGKDDQKMTEDLLAQDSEMRYSQEKLKSEASGDGPNPSLDSDSTGHVFQATRDQRPAAGVKHRNYRVAGTGMDIKLKKGSEFSRKPYSQSSFSDQREPSCGVMDRLASHWQPKAPKFSTDNPQGSRPGGKSIEIGDTTVDVEEAPKTETVPIAQCQEKLPSDASTTDYNCKLDARTDHSNEGAHPEINKRERREPQSRDSSRQHESGVSAVEDFKNQNSHHVKGYDSRADWSSMGRHGKQQQNPSLNHERQRPNSHYRYRPMGMGNNNRMGYVEGSRDASSQEEGSRKNAGQGGASI